MSSGPFMCRAVMADMLRVVVKLGLGRIASSWSASLQPLNSRPFIFRCGTWADIPNKGTGLDSAGTPLKVDEFI